MSNANDTLDEDQRAAFLALPNFDRQFARFSTVMERDLANGTYCRTKWLQAGQPWSTWANVWLDGIGIQNGISVPYSHAPIELPDVLLVGVGERDGTPNHVRTTETKLVAVPGSNRKELAKVNVDRGAWALVPDKMESARLARTAVYRHGWGVRRDTIHVQLVEWAWLAAEVASGASTYTGAEALHASILERFAADPAFRAAAGLSPVTIEKKQPEGRTARV